MTIKVIHAPRAGMAMWEIYSEIKAVTKAQIIRHDGQTIPKRICSKVEVLSAEDFGREDMCKRFGEQDDICEWMYRDYGYIPRMSINKFNEIKLPNFI